MKRISLISLLALSLALTSVAFLASAGGPVVGKRGVYDPVIGVGSARLVVTNTSDTAQANLTTRYFSLDGVELAINLQQLNTHGTVVIDSPAADLPDWMGFMTVVHAAARHHSP